MNNDEMYEYQKHLRARSIEQLEVLRTWFRNKDSEINREQKIKLIDAEIDRKTDMNKSYER